MNSAKSIDACIVKKNTENNQSQKLFYNAKMPLAGLPCREAFCIRFYFFCSRILSVIYSPIFALGIPKGISSSEYR